MKTKGIIFAMIIVMVTICGANAQAPQGISYQSVIRNTSGSAQISTPVVLQFSILQGGETGTPVYVEAQSFTTSAQGLVAATIGQGTPTQGTFSAIDWSLGSYYLKVEANINNQGSYSVSGTSLIASVPYALFAGNAGSASALASMGAKEGDVLKWNGSAWKPAVDSSNTSWGMKDGNIYTTIPGNVGIGTDVPGGKLEVKGSSSDPNVALFEVKDKNGNPIFSVFPNGVEIVFDETAPVRGAKGGFSVSGRNSTRAVVDIMRMTADSTTVYVNNLAKRGAKGGFAVSGRNSTRATSSEILRVTPDSTRIYTSDPAKGFGVGQVGSGAAGGYLKLLPENYFIGHQSGLNTTGLYNTFFGYTAGLANTTGASNIFVGYETGNANVSGNWNTFLGYQAGKLNTGSDNTFIGYQAGSVHQVKGGNVYIGSKAGGNAQNGERNVFIGESSGYNLTTGVRNIFIGFETGLSNTTGVSNVFIGDQSGRTNTTGGWNTFLGYQTGYTNNGSFNSFLGYRAGLSNTTGLYNSFMGFNAGLLNTTGSNNVFIGNESGRANSVGDYNTFMGFRAGYANNASYNSFIGFQAGKANTSGAYNSFMGFNAGLTNTTGLDNVFIGNKAGLLNVDGSYNVFLGSEAGNSNVDGLYNTFLGYQAGFSNTGGASWLGDFNTFIGYQAGYSATSGYRNIAIGYQAGFGLTTNRYNVLIGETAGYSLSTGQANVCIGTYSGRALTSGAGNIVIGLDAGYTNSVGQDNVYLGLGAGRASTGNRCVFLGTYAGYSETGDDKLYIENTTSASPLIGGDFATNRVGIGRMPITYTLEVAGTIWANGTAITAGIATWSDQRFKTNITPLANSLDLIMKLKGVRFDWNRSAYPERNFTIGKQVGFIAQDVESVLPEVVTTDAEGFKSVSYDKVTAVLVEAIKEQQKSIEQLKAENDALKKQIEEIKQMVLQLKK